MPRTRISTTVDAERLEAVRQHLDASDSEIIDRALAVLLDALEGSFERKVLAERPYEADSELTWQAPFGPDLPYDGTIPEHVHDRVAERRTGGE